MKKFLFAGCGSIGRRHITNLKRLIPCQILAYRVQNESLGDFEKENQIKAFYNLDEALDQKPDAVFVTNPTSLHLPVARKAAERSCPLFIEKPLSHNLDGVDKFIRLCQKNKVLVMMGYKMRFHPSIQKIKKLTEDGKIGKVIRAQSYYGGYLPNWHPWEDYRRMYSSRQDLGGGIILDAIHEIDYLYWILGDVDKVKAFCGKLGDLDIETEDTAEIILHFKSNCFGNVHLNYTQHPDYRFCQITGTEGMILWDDNIRTVRLFTTKKNQWENFPEKETLEPNKIFIEELKYFLSCLEGKKKVNHSLYDAKRVLEIALQAKSAWAEKGDKYQK